MNEDTARTTVVETTTTTLTPRNLRILDTLHISSTLPSLLMHPPSDLQIEEPPSMMEDSTFEIIRVPSILSDDDGGQTVSVASQSVDGDTADDFSSINSNAGYSSDEEEIDEHRLTNISRSQLLSEASKCRQPYSESRHVEDSGWTARPCHLPSPAPEPPSDSSTALHENARADVTPGECRWQSPRTPRPDLDTANPCDEAGIWMMFRARLGRAMASPAMRYISSLPWVWIFALALLNITVIYAANSYNVVQTTSITTPPLQPSTPPMTTKTRAKGVFEVSSSPPAATASSKISTAGPWTFKDDPQLMRMAKQLRPNWVRLEKDLEVASKIMQAFLSDRPLGRTVSTDAPDGTSFLVVGTRDRKGFLVICPPSLAVNDPPLTIFASRKNSPIELITTKVGCGSHHVSVAMEDAFGDIDVVIKTDAKPFIYEHQRIHLRSSWLPLTIQPSTWVEAASNMVQILKSEVLALETITKDLTIQVGTGLCNSRKFFSRESKGWTASALQRLDRTTKELMHLPRQSWAATIKMQHEIHSARKAVTGCVAQYSQSTARLICSSSGVIQNGVRRAYSDIYKALAERFPSADMSLPLKDPAKALQNARSNARDILHRLRSAGAGSDEQARRGTRKADRKCGREKPQHRDKRRSKKGWSWLDE